MSFQSSLLEMLLSAFEPEQSSWVAQDSVEFEVQLEQATPTMTTLFRSYGLSEDDFKRRARSWNKLRIKKKWDMLPSFRVVPRWNCKKELVYGSTKDDEYLVVIPYAVLESIRQQAEQGNRGGILTGVYDDKMPNALILYASCGEDVDALCKKIWPSAYYVGEWAYCTADESDGRKPYFSSEMKRIAKESRYDCREPILIIMGEGEFSAAVFPNGESEKKFELRL